LSFYQLIIEDHLLHFFAIYLYCWRRFEEIDFVVVKTYIVVEASFVNIALARIDKN